MSKKSLFISIIVFTVLYFGSIGAGLLPESFFRFFGGGNSQTAVVAGADSTQQDPKTQITELYRTLLRREPTTDEINYWLVRYNFGWSMQTIESNIKITPEYRSLRLTPAPVPVQPPALPNPPTPIPPPEPPIKITDPAPIEPCYLLLSIKEKKSGSSMLFSLESVQEKEGKYFRTLVEPYYTEDGADYILETYGGTVKTGRYALYSSRFFIAESFGASSQGKIFEADEGMIETYIPVNFQAHIPSNPLPFEVLTSVAINNNGTITEFGKNKTGGNIDFSTYQCVRYFPFAPAIQ